jgi:hypothetical protein
MGAGPSRRLGSVPLDVLPGHDIRSRRAAGATQNGRGIHCPMQKLEADGKITTFHETMLGTTIHVFGNVAVALGACEMLENGEEVTRDVGAFLFVKDAGRWRIAGQAWDLETEANPIPAHLRKPEA